MARPANSRSMRILEALVALCIFGAPSSLSHSQISREHARGRRLQKGTAGTPVYVEMTNGENIISSQEDGVQLLVSIAVRVPRLGVYCENRTNCSEDSAVSAVQRVADCWIGAG